MYRAVARSMLQSTKKQDIFGHIFLLTCWNLMCRAKNSESIRYGHISWYEDSLTITFAHMKNDQDGSRPRDPRHVYSNPIMPEVCPVLGLAIYFAVLGFSPDGKLFAGENQYSRFLKVLKEILNRDVMNVTLAEVSMSANSFGTHSARKGAATYVSGCSTSGPSAAAICLRAGWTLPGVQDKYIRYEAAGDMVVGRFVAGLPFDSPNFAVLPPFFDIQSGQNDESVVLRHRVKEAMNSIFPGVPSNLSSVCQFCLASLLYHRSFLLKTLPSTHLLFATPVFSSSNESQLQWLRQRVVCRNVKENDIISSSGIPPHVGLMVELAHYKSEMVKMREDLSHAFEAALKRHINGSVKTMEALEAAFSSVLARSSLVQHNLHLVQSALDNTNATCIDQSNGVRSELILWDGTFHRVAKDFVLPSGTVRVVWQQWCGGQPPLRLLTKHDMSSRLKKVRLSELRRVMLLIEALLTQEEL
ncbi:cysteine desulfurase [Phytophthora nicotianae]|nr:cysteine desulfurase [Phytophthora nicotianae]